MPPASQVLKQLVIPLLSLVGGIFVLVLAVHYLKTWWNGRAEDAGDQPLLLGQYREMLRTGELSEEEYRKIMSRLAARLGGTGSPSPGAGPATVSPLPPEGETKPEV